MNGSEIDDDGQPDPIGRGVEPQAEAQSGQVPGDQTCTDESLETISARVQLSTADWKLGVTFTVPTGPTTLATFVPLMQSFADAVVGAAVQTVEAQGRTISCRAGCGACCRQLVPISQVEARQIGDLVARLPEPRRSAVLARFAAARRRLEQSGTLAKLLNREDWTGDGTAVNALGRDYLRLGLPCPFLEDESCSIHADRPIVCREYLVTSPAEHCAEPWMHRIEQVRMPLKAWTALARCGAAAGSPIRWVPLVIAPEWAAAHPDEPPPRPGPELLRELFNHITGSAQPADVDRPPPAE